MQIAKIHRTYTKQVREAGSGFPKWGTFFQNGKGGLPSPHCFQGCKLGTVIEEIAST
jgi:hypothetical protein